MNIFRRHVLPWMIVALVMVLVTSSTRPLQAEDLKRAQGENETVLLAAESVGVMKTVAVVAIGIGWFATRGGDTDPAGSNAAPAAAQAGSIEDLLPQVGDWFRMFARQGLFTAISPA